MKLILLILSIMIISCKDRKHIAVDMAKEFVKQDMVAPSSAKFPDNDKISVKDEGDTMFKISSYVDAQNSFGAMIRKEWQEHLKFLGGDEKNIKNWLRLNDYPEYK